MRALLVRAAVEGETATGGSGGIAGLIEDNVIQIILLVVAAAALFAGKNGNISKTVTIAACALIGLMVLALSVNNGELGKLIGDFLARKIRETLS